MAISWEQSARIVAPTFGAEPSPKKVNVLRALEIDQMSWRQSVPQLEEKHETEHQPAKDRNGKQDKEHMEVGASIPGRGSGLHLLGSVSGSDCGTWKPERRCGSNARLL